MDTVWTQCRWPAQEDPTLVMISKNIQTEMIQNVFLEYNKIKLEINFFVPGKRRVQDQNEVQVSSYGRDQIPYLRTLQWTLVHPETTSLRLTTVPLPALLLIKILLEFIFPVLGNHRTSDNVVSAAPSSSHSASCYQVASIESWYPGLHVLTCAYT